MYSGKKGAINTMSRTEIPTEKSLKKAFRGWFTATRFNPATPVIGNTVSIMSVTYPAIPESGMPVKSVWSVPSIPVVPAKADIL
jgi:hypothetical protein